MDALLVRVEDLAKGWLLAMLEQASLEEAPAILAVDLARDGPRICDAMVRALASDTDLRRLEHGGALEMLVARAGVLAGEGGLEATSRTIDALQAVIWSAVRGELSDPDADQISELAERLALVVEQVRTAAFRRLERPAGEEPVSARVGEGLSGAGELAREPHVVAVDSEPAEPTSATTQAAAPPSAQAAAPPSPATEEVLPEALWVGALKDEISRAERTSSPLSLLLAELEDADKVIAVEEGSDASATFGRFAQALRGAVRRQDILACETESRAWVISRDTGRMGAQALAGRIAGAVRAAPPWRGAPMVASVGIAVFGEDGRDAAGLIEAAEEARFAASASGLNVSQESPPSDAAPNGEGGPGLAG